MSKKLIALTATTALCIFGAYQLPQLQENKITSLLKGSGLQTIEFDKIQSTLGTVSLHNVKLDPEGISQIKAITIQLSPLGIFSKHIQNITFDAPDIIASLNDRNELIIDGLNSAESFTNINNIAPQTIKIKQSQLTILTDEWGAVTIKGNLSAALNKKQQYEFQANFDSKQKHINLIGNAGGIITPQFTSADLEIETGKINIPGKNLRISRTNGTVNITTNNKQTNLIGEIRAGGMKAGPSVWHNIASTIKFSNNQWESHLSASSLGVNGLELSVTHNNKNTSINIHASTPETLGEYLTINKTNKNDLKSYAKNALNAEVSF